ncbi:DNA polymerase V [Neisseria sp. HSC-16F19]|nr:translesion error-prone DNA polymerase V autoproteolytic subunit [Neisseria sp. HSC-16F19]MCP2041146.1 DNA polymerase V [Neisseria sp. HSC-16F19]
MSDSTVSNHGGSRPGAGRKPGIPTRPVRVPLQLLDTVAAMVAQFKLANATPLDAKFPHPTPSTARIPLLHQRIPAGFPSPAEQYVEDYLDFNEYLIKNQAATITVECGGDSMLDAGIGRGDLLIIDRSVTPKNGDIVMADLGNEFTIKRLYISRTNQVELRSENASGEYPDFRFKEDDVLRIVGVVTFVIKRFR